MFLIPQITVDVKYFESKNLSVKVIEENQLVIEGTLREESEGSIKTQSFQKSFIFPGVTQASKITSKLSSSNILSISVEKKVSNY